MVAEIVPYGPEWESAIPELQKHLWDPDPSVNRAYFEWKYLTNPYLRPPRIQLAVAGGTLIGMRGMYGARWRACRQGETLDVPCAGDLVVLPEHRGGRIVQRILAGAVAELGRSRLPAALNFSGGGPTQLASLMAGWRSVGTIEVAAWDRIPGRPPPTHGPSEARTEVALETACRPHEMAALAQDLTSDGLIRHVRDAEFFAWRYRNPLSRYRFVYVWRDGLAGFAVLQTHVRREPGWAHLVDWEAVDAKTFGILVGAVLRADGFAWLDLWSRSLTQEFRRVLSDLGFTFLAPPPTLGRAHRTGKGRPAVLLLAAADGADDRRGLGIGDRRLSHLADWDLRGIYSDFY